MKFYSNYNYIIKGDYLSFLIMKLVAKRHDKNDITHLNNNPLDLKATKSSLIIGLELVW